MPATAAGLGVDPTDTEQNVDGGVRYLAQLLQEFGGNQTLALAAYNWGPGNISKNGTSNWPTETTNYVSSILASIGNAITGTDTTDTTDASSTGTPGLLGGSSNVIILAAAAALALFVVGELWS
jgi:hypothetical protein